MLETVSTFLASMLKILLVIGLIIGALALAARWLLPNDWRMKYAAQYMLSNDQVTIERKPHNCDWDSAPLGNKHCHYEAAVAVYNSDGRVVDGTGAEVDETGTEISYDGRKTWQVLRANHTPAKVTVVWQRVDD